MVKIDGEKRFWSSGGKLQKIWQRNSFGSLILPDFARSHLWRTPAHLLFSWGAIKNSRLDPYAYK